MQKTIIGVLGILVLALLAVNVRLQERERLLEERLAAAERKRTPRPAPAPEPVIAASEPAAPVAVAPQTAPAPSAPPAVVRIDAIKPAAPAAATSAERYLQRSIQALELKVDDTVLTMPGRVQFTLQSEEPPLPEGRKPGYLGISGGDAQGGGAQVTDVFPNGVAGAAGLKSGDVIVEFNGESVQGLADLARRIRESGEGAPISLRIRRDGAEFYQGVQLGPRP